MKYIAKLYSTVGNESETLMTAVLRGDSKKEAADLVARTKIDFLKDFPEIASQVFWEMVT